MSKEQTFETRLLSSLAKVFADEELKDPVFAQGSALLGESYAFQVAYRRNGWGVRPLRVRAESALGERVSIRAVGLVPSEMPCYADHDDNVLRTTPGLYPDPLYPLETVELSANPGQWRSVWVTVEVTKDVQQGNYPITVVFETNEGEALGSETFELNVVAAALPQQKLIHTDWFHTDCIASVYGDEVFSEAHWNRIEQFIETAAKHGMNMILTPLFTPPLDTAVGGERPTVQLVDVKQTGPDTYSFGFDLLKRWVDLSLARGIEYFEFSHLFTQWGVKHAPKIVAEVEGETKQIFGWDTDASGQPYRTFLGQLLPELVKFIKQHGLEQRSYFHVSDEPGMDHLEAYQSASEILNEHLSEFPVIDALSDYAFYEKGLVKNPIPANNHIEPFLENEVPNLWTYYCCAQYKQVSNRFFNMPSARNRIIGLQMYKFRIAGFLHWGYNFYYSQYSIREIDPFRETSAGNAFASGDSYLVYPGENGPIESLRLEVFNEALQDLRALELLESYIGRDRVVALLDEGLDKPITFSEYPHDQEWLLAKREQINKLIAEHQ